MEYFSTRQKKWIRTVVTDIDVSSERIRLEGKSSWFIKKEFGVYVRHVKAEEQPSASVPASDSECPDNGAGSRQRGNYDGTLVMHAEQCLKSCGGVLPILEKIANVRKSVDNRASYREKLIDIFPKNPQPGVCYIPFNAPPTTVKLVGHLHPNLRCFVACFSFVICVSHFLLVGTMLLVLLGLCFSSLICVCHRCCGGGSPFVGLVRFSLL